MEASMVGSFRTGSSGSGGTGGPVPTGSTSGSLLADVNLDGTVRYTGTANDRDRIMENVGGPVPTSTRVEQLP